MAGLLTTQYTSYISEKLQKAVTDISNTAFYVFTGVHGDVIGDIPKPQDDTRQTVIDAYRNMIFGKRVGENDVALVIRNVHWTANKIFDMYDDIDPYLFSRDFYCYVDEISFIHIYKCLDNNFRAPSTVQPSSSFVTPQSNYIFRTSDGYTWKYMCSATQAQANLFKTQNYIPIIPNANVQNAAVSGAIDVIKVNQNDLDIPGGGKKYDNYVAGTFAVNQLRINANNYLYAISNNQINYHSGFYTGCLIYLSNGPGAGQFRIVDDYFTNSNGNFIVISSPFDIPPQNGTTFEIYPNVQIVGGGTETVNAVARALVNATGSNSIYKIEMLDKGADYNYAAAYVTANGIITQDINFLAAGLRPIYSPNHGHGFDPADELGCDAVEFTMKFANTEDGTLIANNRFQQVGLISDPLFANVNVKIANTSGGFTPGEPIIKVSPLVRINSNVFISNLTSIISGESSVLTGAAIITVGSNGTYIPGDILTVIGGTAFTPAELEIEDTIVRTVTLNNHGTSYVISSSFTAELQVGSGNPNATFTVTTNSIGGCETIVLVTPGSYSVNPPFLANSHLVGGSGSGLTVSLEMGLGSVSIFDQGAYAVLPTALANNEPISNIGTGSGAQVLLTFSPVLSSDFLNQLDDGDLIYLSNPEGTLQQLASVNSITNSTSLTISVNGFFTCAAAQMFVPTLSTTATLNATANVDHILLSSVRGELFTDDILVGGWTSAKTQVDSVLRNDVQKDLRSFIQLHKYDVSVLSGDFVENEIVYQGNSLAFATATALVFSVEPGVNTFYLYTSNQVGVFTTNTFLNGANSLALASMNKPYSPELEFGSGEVLYLENLDAVNRTNTSTETIQLILSF